MKKLCAILVTVLILSLTVLGIVLMWNQSTQYSPHRWFEGYREDVIYDVLEEYAYPGASVEKMLEALGEGNEADSDLLARICTFAKLPDGDGEADVKVFVYNIEGVYGQVTDYLAVISRGDCVVQTMLVSEEK